MTAEADIVAAARERWALRRALLGPPRQGKAKLCGPEKALWEPIPSLWENIFDWAEEKCNYLLAYLRAMG